MSNPDQLSWNSSSSMHSFLSKYWKEIVIVGLVGLCIYLYKNNEKMPPLFQGRDTNASRNVMYSANGMNTMNPMNPMNNPMNPYAGNKPIISYDPVYGDMMDVRPVDVRREAMPKRTDPGPRKPVNPPQELVQEQQQQQQQMVQMVGNQIAPVQFGEAASYYSYKK